MELLMDYFERLPDIVYIVDIDTYKIVFMNKAARDIFNLDNNGYKGKICYELLQGFKSPCLFCTNSMLKNTAHYQWEHYNPIIKNKYFITDSLIEVQGKKYKVEIAAKKLYENKDQDSENLIYTHEAFINQCLMQIYKNLTPAGEIEAFLEYIGLPSESDSIYVYEWKDKRIYVSYSWPDKNKSDVNSVLDREISFEIKKWYEQNGHNEPFLIKDTAHYFKIVPKAFEHILNKNISNMLLVPIFWHEEVISFMRFDNVAINKVKHLIEIMKILSHFLALMLIRRDNIKTLTELSYNDQLTGLFNRHALFEYKNNIKSECGIGVIYCDAVGLKNINDTQGHDRGDEIIVKMSSIMSEVIGKKYAYRVGGDEFVCILDCVPQEQFYSKVKTLKECFAKNGLIVSIGCAYKEGKVTKKDFEEISKQADEKMYEDKRNYYLKAISPKSDTANIGISDNQISQKGVTPLQYFVKNYYFNTEIFMSSVALPDTALYLFCGDMSKNVFYISENLKKEFGFESCIVSGLTTEILSRVCPEDKEKCEKTHMEAWKNKSRYYSNQFKIYNYKNEPVLIHAQGQVKWENDMPVFFAGTLTTIKNESYFDFSTGLPNILTAKNEIAFLPKDTSIMLIGFSVRNFENINQIVGLCQGDEILRQIGINVRDKIGKNFKIYRLDGLHFLAVTDKKYDSNLAVSNIKEVVETVMKNNHVYTMKPCAIAVMHYKNSELLPQEIIDNVLLATKMVKSMPDRDYLVFDQSFDIQNNIDAHMSMDLNSCIANDFEGFRIVVQPQVSLLTGNITGGEVLLRWTNKGQNIPPNKFIPILENCGIIVPLGKWIIQQTIKTALEAIKINPDFTMSFNLSYIQVIDETLFDYFKQTMEHYGVPGKNIVVELTETYFDDMPKHLKKFVDKCNDIGVSFALDDFGNGYSSLNLLLKYPISIVKVDKALLREISVSEKKKRFIQSIINACHAFEEKVCVEGVETKDQLEFIKNTMCDYIQGFYFYKPLELDDFYRLIKQNGGGNLLFYENEN